MWSPGSLVSAWFLGWGGYGTVNQTTEWSHLEVRRLGRPITVAVSSLARPQCVSGEKRMFEHLSRHLQASQLLWLKTIFPERVAQRKALAIPVLLQIWGVSSTQGGPGWGTNIILDTGLAGVLRSLQKLHYSLLSPLVNASPLPHLPGST